MLFPAQDKVKYFHLSKKTSTDRPVLHTAVPTVETASWFFFFRVLQRG
jgi:hypothetical protein